ncbi:MAG TPA: hypothetical protein DD637_00740, partial [Verrucomicrobia bacterium]|nr:hypothetical protein [Verrucomicrobiota bacterium]
MLCVARLRLVIAVVVHPDGEASGTHSRFMLRDCLAFVSSVKKPRLVRGDVSFGNESALGDREEADVRYLFKMRRTKRVCGEFRALLADADVRRDASGDGHARSGTSSSIRG